MSLLNLFREDTHYRDGTPPHHPGNDQLPPTRWRPQWIVPHLVFQGGQDRIPRYHPVAGRVSLGTVTDDAGGWVYDNDPADLRFGAVWINCTHTDTKNKVWSSY